MSPRIPILFLLAAACAVSAYAAANDDMYPIPAAVQPYIDVDGRGFIVKGQRTYIESGSIHYPRVPPELWRDRLLRLRRASFNTVQTYAFWNFSEPRENEWHLTGAGDIGAYLATAQSLGLYATVRVGPYVCAEWDMGGFPLWLKFKPGVVVRTDNAPYLELNDHWYDKIMPIVAAHQISRGGNVIMVQLENEHRGDWGVVHDPYFDHLEAKAEENGIEVAHFMSGMHHGPAPTTYDPDTSKRNFPWYSTESWNGWFDTYGDISAAKLRDVEWAQWNTMANGGAGQNFYMAHGGTDFDTWNYGGVAASYDYGAPIGQTGDLRPVYYRMKRANQLAESFPDILANGSNAAPDYKDLATGAQLMGARRSDAGTIIFLHNPQNKQAVATLKDGTTITMRKSESFPLVENAAIATGIKIVDSTARVLAVAHNGNTTTVVVYGVPGDRAMFRWSSALPMNAVSAAPGLVAGQAGSYGIPIQFPQAGADEFMFNDGRQNLRIVSVGTDLSWYVWVIGEKGKQSVVAGPEYVSEFDGGGGRPAMLVERPYGAASPGQAIVYGATTAHLAVTANPAADDAPAPALGAWQMALAREAQPGFDDSKWMATPDPQQMGADGDTSAFAWYRATVQMPAAGMGAIHLQGSDNLSVFVNGAPVKSNHDQGESWTAQANFDAGANSIAVFTSHSGRPDLYNYVGSLADMGRKGLYGPVTIDANGAKIPVQNWRMRGGVDPASFGAWSAPAPGDGTPALYQTSFQAPPPAAVGPHPIYRATFSGLSRGTMWLNSHNLGRYPEKIRIDGLYLPECWLKPEGNTLAVFDETGAAPAQVKIEIEMAASREVIRVDQPCDPATPIVVPAEGAAADFAKANAGNLAYDKPATASSSESNNDPANATDGDPDSRWCASGPSEPQWLSIDLGAAQAVGSCEIVWENRALGYKYTLEGSADGTNWQKLGDDASAVPQSPDSQAQLSRVIFPAATLRYLRVTVTHADNNKWASIRELRAFKPQ